MRANIDSTLEWLADKPRETDEPFQTPMTPLSGKSFSFLDIDMLESGQAKENLNEEYLCPVKPDIKSFRLCHIRRMDKDKFWLYCDDDNSLMLSAKKVGQNFYISQYLEFPENFISEEQNEYQRSKASYCAVLRLNEKNQHYRLFYRNCEGCDNVLAKHTCGPRVNPNGDRQLLADIQQFIEVIEAGEDRVDCNVVRISLPNVYTDLSRDIWCARKQDRGTLNKYSCDIKNRTIQNGVLKHESSLQSISTYAFDEESKDDVRIEKDDHLQPAKFIPKASRLLHHRESTNQPGISMNNGDTEIEESKSDDENADEREPEPGDSTVPVVAAGNGTKKGACTLTSKKPRFDSVTNSLRMKFHNNRVRLASSKNMIFAMGAEDIQNPIEQEDKYERTVFQFGKVSNDRFNLDYRFPLSAVQAFGMALSLFNWQASKPK